MDSNAGTVTPGGVFRAGFTEGNFRNALVVTARAPTELGLGLMQATATVIVKEFSGQLQPAMIRIFPETVNLEPGETMPLAGLVVDSNGVGIPGINVAWEMVGPEAGSISQEGRLTAGKSIGEFPGAIRVTALHRQGDQRELISKNLDVQVVDPVSAARLISASLVPQVISLRPKEQIRFTAMVLDKRGNRIFPMTLEWEILDPKAGIITQDGQCRAGVVPGIYADAVRVSLEVPGLEERVVPSGTIIIEDIVLPTNLTPEQLLPRVAIYPSQVVLSPGEQARLSIVGLDADIQKLSETNISWSLDPPEVGNVSQYITVTAHDFPGIYEGAIRAEVTLNTESGPVTREVSASLIIRGPLESVELTPQVDTLARGEKSQFRARAYDKNRTLLADVGFRWRVTNPLVGIIDADGVFTAEGLPGEYPGAIEVVAVQRPAN